MNINDTTNCRNLNFITTPRKTETEEGRSKAGHIYESAYCLVLVVTDWAFTSFQPRFLAPLLPHRNLWRPITTVPLEIKFIYSQSLSRRFVLTRRSVQWFLLSTLSDLLTNIKPHFWANCISLVSILATPANSCSALTLYQRLCSRIFSVWRINIVRALTK